MYGRWVLGLGKWLKGVMREDERRKGELPETEEAGIVTRATHRADSSPGAGCSAFLLPLRLA